MAGVENLLLLFALSSAENARVADRTDRFRPDRTGLKPYGPQSGPNLKTEGPKHVCRTCTYTVQPSTACTSDARSTFAFPSLCSHSHLTV